MLVLGDSGCVLSNHCGFGGSVCMVTVDSFVLVTPIPSSLSCKWYFFVVFHTYHTLSFFSHYFLVGVCMYVWCLLFAPLFSLKFSVLSKSRG